MECGILTKQFYERNDHVLNSSINLNYEDIVAMTPIEFEKWVIAMRTIVVNAWDTYGCPVRIGKNEQDIIEQFNKMSSYPIHKFTKTDELGGVGDDVIMNASGIGSEADQWFSNMMKVRINYTEKDNGYSIYDLFNDNKYLPRMVKGAMRHIRRDSFYNFALSAIRNDAKYSIISVDSGREWIDAFFKDPTGIFKNMDFILEKNKKRVGVNTGYYQINGTDILHLTKDEVLEFKSGGLLKYQHHSTFDIENMSDDCVYCIRVYERGQKVFPKCFPSFRIGYIQVAVNFPPMTAKYLYERYTNHIKKQDVINIYDPSCGWGGRILGAMSVKDDRNIHYIGTDPNPDNFFPGGSKYEDIANFYNTRTYRGNPFFSSTNTHDVYMLGSEEIYKDTKFQQYKGMVDLVFTSPPYFNREAYSEDENQSYKKFSSYVLWRDGFLKKTLETCYEWLRPGRYLLWNVADLLVNGKYLPIEQDSKDILESLGMEYKYTLKMTLQLMPGQNRLDENGLPKCKNFCRVGGAYLKYEPIFVFYKPE